MSLVLIFIVVAWVALTAITLVFILKKRRTISRAVVWGAFLGATYRIPVAIIAGAISNLEYGGYGATMPYIGELITCAVVGSAFGAIIFAAMSFFNALTRPKILKDI